MECRVIADALQVDDEENEMKIPGFTAEAVKHFLNLIYSGQIPEHASAIDIYALADKYEAAQLKTQCIEQLFKDLKSSNAIKTFEFAHKHGLQDLKTAATAEVQKFFPQQILPEHVKNDVKVLKELVEAARSYKRKIDKAEKEFAEILSKKAKK